MLWGDLEFVIFLSNCTAPIYCNVIKNSYCEFLSQFPFPLQEFQCLISVMEYPLNYMCVLITVLSPVSFSLGGGRRAETPTNPSMYRVSVLAQVCASWAKVYRIKSQPWSKHPRSNFSSRGKHQVLYSCYSSSTTSETSSSRNCLQGLSA